MRSHELARLLLARRDNEVKIEILIDDDPTGEAYRTVNTDLRCDDDLIDSDLRAQPVVTYWPMADAVLIAAGSIAGGAAHRGSKTEAWIKRKRDEMGSPVDDGWRTLDDLLDDYRLHADTGTPLDSTEPMEPTAVFVTDDE